jgi:hypothetical protein
MKDILYSVGLVMIALGLIKLVLLGAAWLKEHRHG